MAKRYLGVDYGSKRIGLAVAEDDVRVARPWQVIDNPGSPVDTFRNLTQGEKITDIVVGLPRSLDGNDTPQTALVRRFASQLEKLGLPITLQDEADTSNVAHKNRPDKRRVDAEAAALILQDYLEGL